MQHNTIRAPAPGIPRNPVTKIDAILIGTDMPMNFKVIFANSNINNPAKKLLNMPDIILAKAG